MEYLGYLVATGISTGALYALVALGIVVIYKATQVVNFAHGEMFMLGGFFAFTFHVMLGWPYLPSFALAVALAFAVGIAVDRIAFRPLMQRQTLVSVLLVMIGLSFVLKGVARWLWGGKGDYLTFPPLISPEPLSFAGIMVMSQQLVVLGAACTVMIVFALFFKLTRAGRFMQATADNPKAAKLVGLRTDRVYMYTFGVGSAVAAAAAVLMAPLTLLYPDIGFMLFVKAFAAAVLGGLTSIPGAVVGGFLIGIIEQLAAGYLHTAMQEVAAFIVIMIVMIFIPTGLFGIGRTRKV